MIPTKHSLFFVAALLPLLIGEFSFAQSAGSYGLSDPVKTKNGVTYMCSGIGESKDDSRTQGFPMKIVFATVSRALYSDVNVRITKEGGESVFDVFCDGAWLLVKLPPGKYNVSATDKKGQSRSGSMNIGASQSQIVLTWPD